MRLKCTTDCYRLVKLDDRKRIEGLADKEFEMLISSETVETIDRKSAGKIERVKNAFVWFFKEKRTKKSQNRQVLDWELLWCGHLTRKKHWLQLGKICKINFYQPHFPAPLPDKSSTVHPPVTAEAGRVTCHRKGPTSMLEGLAVSLVGEGGQGGLSVSASLGDTGMSQ